MEPSVALQSGCDLSVLDSPQPQQIDFSSSSTPTEGARARWKIQMSDGVAVVPVLPVALDFDGESGS